MSQTQSLLDALGRRRDELLKRLTDGLQADSRVQAVWLTGSFGRSEDDALSDLDLHVIVTDADYEAIVAQPRQLFELAGSPHLVLSVSGPSDSMPEGRFWLVLYEHALEVDWNIGPTRSAERAAASIMLFDRMGVPTAATPDAVSPEHRRAIAQGQLTFFWAMSPIALKYAARGHTYTAVRQTELLRSAYIALWRAVYRPDLLQNEAYDQNRLIEDELDADLPRFDATITPMEAWDNIRQFCAAVEALHPQLAELGVVAPTLTAQDVVRFADEIRPLVEQGGFRPDSGRRR